MIHVKFVITVVILLWMFLGMVSAVIGPLIKATWPLWVHVGAMAGLVYMLISIAADLTKVPL